MKKEYIKNIDDLNKKIKLSKAKETLNKDDFDAIWDKYIVACKNELKQSYNTYHKKEKNYKKYFQNKIKTPITKIENNFMNKYIDKLKTTEKQKNEIIRILRVFFNWCLNEDIIITNPMRKIKYYKTNKPKIKYWLPEEIKKFFDYMDQEINTTNINKKEEAYKIKLFVMISFSLGDRTGETRALKFKNIDKTKRIISIRHSTAYDPKSLTFISNTKTYSSEREITVTQKLIDEIYDYKNLLINYFNCDITDDDFIFFNKITKKPLSDVALRKSFYRYCEKAEVPKMRLYDLRHTYVATMMSEDVELYLIVKD